MEWKNGCPVEQLPLKTANRTKNFLAMYLIIAWRGFIFNSRARYPYNLGVSVSSSDGLESES